MHVPPLRRGRAVGGARRLRGGVCTVAAGGVAAHTRGVVWPPTRTLNLTSSRWSDHTCTRSNCGVIDLCFEQNNLCKTRCRVSCHHGL